MTSGNFLVGHNLSIRGFQSYVAPRLIERGFVVADMLSVQSEKNNQAILASIFGEGNLEKALDESLVQTGKQLEQERMNPTQPKPEPIAYEFQVWGARWEGQGTAEAKRLDFGIYKTLGLYSANNTATNLFPILANGYLVAKTEQEIEKLKERVRAIGTTLSALK